MTEFCSRQCCWLTMAGFFIFVGTIQWSAGLVLLKSKYVFLLSGPNFWTSAANIITGCFLGIAAVVWKKPRKKRFFSRSSRYVVRENMVSALLVSSVILNATTATILIMSEGNTILTIKVEAMNEKTPDMGEELLRFAYAASVVCPVVCLVVAAMVATERCCTARTFKSGSPLGTPLKQNRGRNFLVEVSPKQYNWVFDQEQDISGEYLKQNPQPKEVSPSSSSCDEVTGQVSVELFSPTSKAHIHSTPTVADLQNSLARMSHTRTSGHSEDSLEARKDSPLAGEVVAIQVHTEPGDSTNQVPVEQPLTRGSSLKGVGKSEVDAAPTRVRTLMSEDVSSKLHRNKMSSFRVVQRQDPKTERFSPGKKNIRRSKSPKSPTMESIVEVPVSEDAGSFQASPSVTSGYGTSPEVIENVSKEAPYTQTTRKQISVPGEMETPRKSSTGTVPKDLYGKLSLFRQARIFAESEE